MTEYQITDAVLATTPIDKGTPRFVLVDTNTFTAYVSYRKTDQILAVDLKNNMVVSRINIQSPGDMTINSVTKKLYCATRGKISIIDTSKKEMVDVIKPEIGAAEIRLAINKNTNLLYTSYGSDRVVVYDCATNARVDEFSEGIREGSGIAVDSKENKVYVVNAHDNSVAVYDGSSGAFSHDVKVRYGPDMPIGPSYRLDGKAFLYASRGLLYAVGSMSEGDGAGGGGTGYYLHVINFESGYLLNSKSLSSLSDDGLIAIDEEEDKIYLSKGTKILELSVIGKKTREISVLKTSFWKRIFFHGCPIAYDHVRNRCYRADGNLGFLSIIDAGKRGSGLEANVSTDEATT